MQQIEIKIHSENGNYAQSKFTPFGGAVFVGEVFREPHSPAIVSWIILRKLSLFFPPRFVKSAFAVTVPVIRQSFSSTVRMVLMNDLVLLNFVLAVRYRSSLSMLSINIWGCYQRHNYGSRRNRSLASGTLRQERGDPPYS
jgi:hypothetical protein